MEEQFVEGMIVPWGHPRGLAWRELREHFEFCIFELAATESQHETVSRAAAAREAGFKIGFSLRFGVEVVAWQVAAFREAAQQCGYRFGDIAPLAMTRPGDSGSPVDADGYRELVESLLHHYGECIVYLDDGMINAASWASLRPRMIDERLAERSDHREWSMLLRDAPPSRPGESSLLLRVRARAPLPKAIGEVPLSIDAAALDNFDWSRLTPGAEKTLLWADASAHLEARKTAGVRHFLAAFALRGAQHEDLDFFLGLLKPRPEDPRDRRALLAQRFEVPIPSEFDGPLSPDRFGNDLRQAVERALAGKPDQPIEDADLLLSVLTPTTSGVAPAEEALRSAGFDPELLLEGLATDLLPASAPAVNAILRARRGLSLWNRPNFDLDRVQGPISRENDHLNAAKAAERFAKLFAVKGIDPPIALGLFGRWGSGKSTFMGLMKGCMAQLVGQPGYVRRVVPIDFNAWHYQDTNLWASLALRIYEGLANALADAAKKSGAQQTPVDIQRELKARVESSRKLKEQVRTERKEALSKRAENVEQLERTQAERERRIKTRALLPLEAAWKLLRDELKGANAEPDLKALGEAARTVEDKFGIPAVLETAEDLEKLEKQAREALGEARGLRPALEKQFGSKGGVRGALTILLLGALVVCVGWGVLTLKGWAAARGAVWAERLPDYSAAVVQFTALVSVIAAWSGTRIHEAKRLIALVGRVRETVRQKQAEIGEETRAEVILAEAAVRESDQEIQRLEGEIQQADAVIRDTTAEIDRIEKGGLIYDFVKERGASERYQSALSLVSTLREDLGTLDSLLSTFKDASGVPVERIVLYIDDLDRCPPEQVVEVLQAVHLLLAFPLFHVVVGVDPRWLSQSLRRRYVRDPSETFDPHEYLEKIFQIPYTLPDMTQHGFASLIGALVKTRSDLREAAPKLESPSDPKPSEPAAKNAGSGEDASVAHGSDEPKPEPQPVSAHAESGAPASDVLFIEDFEERFLVKLYAFMDRPRLTKRFLNLYRLIRLRAAEDPRDFEDFAGSPSAHGYRAAGLLLAINVGHPRLGQRLLQAVIDTPAVKRDVGPDGSAEPLELTWTEFLEQPPAGAIRQSDLAELGLVRSRLRGIDKPKTLGLYKPWAEAVICYSFQWERAETESVSP
jgi:hypothetical protein